MKTIHTLNIQYEDSYHQNTLKKLMEPLSGIWQHQSIITDKTIMDLTERILRKAVDRECDHGFSGAMSSSGAYDDIRELRGFLEGIVYANTLDITKTKWASLSRQIELERDPELAEFERLKKKFAHLEQK